MKHLTTLLLLAILCLSGCSQVKEDNGDVKTKAKGEYVSGRQIFLSPFTFNEIPGREDMKNHLLLNFDKKGGQAKVIAYFPEEDEVSLNDEWGIGTSDVLRDPLIKDERIIIQRTKLDDFRSEYLITVHENHYGISYDTYIDIKDASKVRDDKGTPLISGARITIRQAVN